MSADAPRADTTSGRERSLRLAVAEALGRRDALPGDDDVEAALHSLIERLLAERLAAPAAMTAPMREALLAAAEVDLGGIAESPVFRNRILSYRVRVDVVEKLTAGADSARREYEALQVLNAHMAARGRPPVFPRAFYWSQDPPAVAMEYVKGRPFHEAFEDGCWRGGVGGRHGAWRTRLTALFGQLAGLYAGSVREGAPAEAGYVYGRRFSHVVGREDFLATFAACLGGEAPAWRRSFADLAATPVSVNGEKRRAYGDYAARLLGDGGVAVPPVRCLVHGDLHAANVIWREDDGVAMLIDPRCDWDGHPLVETATGDPLLDVAFIYHGLELMGPLLGAADGRPFQGAEMREGRGPDRAGTDLRVPLLFDARHPFPEAIRALCMDHLPPGCLAGHWRQRLHVGIACAYLGWLKHHRVVRDASRWLAVYGAVLWHLGIAEEMRSVAHPPPAREGAQ